ncbi:hypothetical protein EAH89_05085 [Roseomonas nepalensis]|uniref:AAA+ ATPase domain-containing protein n=1 Tax=Muricoccus nepalensis TaxID=1854500 RepID=A0A502GC01_9PROT|nr:ATP-binding protein [Roseomonas nepalensis]TPG59619.1 hypothetical protein EAH89_05085 [Roseomonas nepalensis]
MPHAAWAAARRAILQAFATGEHLVALLGPPGVGKTCLLREVEAALRPQAIRVLRLESGDGAEGALAAAPETEVLLVDEADRMSESALEEVAEREGCFAVLVGLPPLARRLAPWPHRIVELPPLPAGEIPSYLTARMIIAELDAARLTEGAAAALAELSGGTPRLLNLLLAMAYHEADMTGGETVLESHVREAAALRAEAAEALAGHDAPPPRAAAEPAGKPVRLGRPEPAPRSFGRALSLTPPPPPEEEPARRRLAPAVLAGAIVLLLGGLAWFSAREVPRPATRAEGAAPPGEQAAAAPAPPPADPAPAPPRTAGAALPSGAMVRVVLTYPRGAAEAARRGVALAASLTQAGIAVGAPFPVSRPPAGPALSYFFREDREAALRIAGLGGLDAGAAQLGAPGGAAPRPGTIELALAQPGAAAEERDASAGEEDLPAPAAASLAYPPEGTTLPADAAWRGVVLAWSTPGDNRPGCCFIEVVSLGAGRPGEGVPAFREVFAAYAEAPDQQLVQLAGAGRYAWRVLTVSRAARRYSASPWRHFAIGGAPS